MSAALLPKTGAFTESGAQLRVLGENSALAEFLSAHAGMAQRRESRPAVFLPPLTDGINPDLGRTRAILRDQVAPVFDQAIIISSTSVYAIGPEHPGMAIESDCSARILKNSAGSRWLELESLAHELLHGHSKLTILRSAPVLIPGRGDMFARLLGGRWSFTLPGRDPTLQFLSPHDLARAIRSVIETGAEGIYNIAPKSAIPLHEALRLSGTRRVAVPGIANKFLQPSVDLELIKYHWTSSRAKAAASLAFRPQHSSAQAVRDYAASLGRKNLPAASEYDGFGMDPSYIAAFGRTLFRFLHDYYWRIEIRGLDRVPRDGAAVLVGAHRGFMPWDGVMALHAIFEATARIPRFLIHPCLLRFPFLFNFMTKLGGITASNANADHVLARGELLGVFPEGIRGAFRRYRNVYQLGKFGRDEFVRMALRNRAPIVPFVTVGSAEIFPILAKIDWGWWKKLSDWPAFPITATFPLLPVPLPSKWHTRFLDPIHVEEHYEPEDAGNTDLVRRISQQVRNGMQAAIDQMLKRRRWIFWGSIFAPATSVERPM
jgi:1-acyl-sn-glycerol-3-phosphate acyltransferase